MLLQPAKGIVGVSVVPGLGSQIAAQPTHSVGVEVGGRRVGQFGINVECFGARDAIEGGYYRFVWTGFVLHADVYQSWAPYPVHQV